MKVVKPHTCAMEDLIIGQPSLSRVGTKYHAVVNIIMMELKTLQHCVLSLVVQKLHAGLKTRHPAVRKHLKISRLD